MEDTGGKAAKIQTLCGIWMKEWVYHLLVCWWRRTWEELWCRGGGAHVLLVFLNPASHRRTLCLQLAEVDSPGAVAERLLCARSRHVWAWNINHIFALLEQQQLTQQAMTASNKNLKRNAKNTPRTFHQKLLGCFPFERWNIEYMSLKGRSHHKVMESQASN